MNLKKILSYLLSLNLALIVSPQVFCQIGFNPRIDSVINLATLQTMSRLNRQLSGDTAAIIGGSPYTIVSRHWQNASNPKAAQYIYESFQSFGLNTRYQVNTATNINVIGLKTGSKYPNKQYIICGHYDDMPSGSLAPGADDNASGTCAVIEAARLLGPFTFDYTLIFIAFDEEERGLYGSRGYADTAFQRGDSILGVFNFDMIAFDSNNDYLCELRTNTNSIPLADNVRFTSNLYVPTLNPNRIINTTQNSDHASFWNRGYRAFLGIESGSDFNNYYHTINDNFSHVNLNFFLRFTRAAIASFMTYGWDCFMTFVHTPIQSSSDTSPRTAVALIQSPLPIAGSSNAPRLYYKVNSGPFTYVNAFYNNLDTFKFLIPGQPIGTTVSYYIAAQDSLARFVASLPAGGRGLNPPGTTPPPTLFSYSILTGIVQNEIPVEFKLEQNYPNPFNINTNINIELGKSSHVKLAVYDAVGREISVLINDKLPVGENLIRFDAGNLPSGVYFYTLFLDDLRFDTKKMVLIK